MGQARTAAVILAAGKGTRLKTELPKVLHEVCGRPMLAYVLDACRQAGIDDCIVVVGYGKQLVMDAFTHDERITWVEQTEQRGTGHAVMVCREQLAGYDEAVVLCGDGPLIRAETLTALLEKHRAEQSAATLATAILDDPTGYGRIHRDEAGNLRAIVEHGDCTEEQRRIREVNPSYYCFDGPKLLKSLDQLKPNNVKNEYYITDCIAILLSAGDRAHAITSVPPEDIFSINSRKDLALVNAVMRDRVVSHWQDNGVTVVDPATTWIDTRASIGMDTILYPNVSIQGAAQVGANCRVGPFAVLNDGDEIADGALVQPFTGGR